MAAGAALVPAQATAAAAAVGAEDVRTAASHYAAGGPGGGLRLIGTQRIDGRMSDLTFSTPLLRGDTHVRVMLPASYDPQRRYPVLYLLHGGNDNYMSWTTPGKGEAEQQTAGLPLIVVMPDDGLAGWYTDWYNNGAFGPPRWESYDIGQLIPWIDAHYPVIASRAGRAIAGLSMGGFGAMSYAAQQPDMFIAAASFSGAVDTNTPPYAPTAIDSLSLLDGGPPGSLFGPYLTQQVRWRGHNPWDLAANLRGLSLVIRTGNGQPGGPYGGGGPTDVFEPLVHAESVSLHRRLTALGIPHVWDDYGPGGHDWPYWNRDLAETLPIFMADFAHPPAPPGAVTYTSIQPLYQVFGWSVSVRRGVLEFSTLGGAGAAGFTLTGSGAATVVTPPYYRPGQVYRVAERAGGACVQRLAAADSGGRLHLPVSLGPSDTVQQYEPTGNLGRHPVTAQVIIGAACIA
jgi:S-formylglutathione hydrolase FrmB